MTATSQYSTPELQRIFSDQQLADIFPAHRTDQFFDALFGDPSEGAFDIALKFSGQRPDAILFEFQLRQRPGKCLACNLTYGLPDVFKRHPVINANEVFASIQRLLDGHTTCTEWALGLTKEMTSTLHVIPFTIYINSAHP